MKSVPQGRSLPRRLGGLLLGYLTVAVLAIVLAPFELAWPERLDWTLAGPGGGRLDDLLLNVILFVPLGFLAERLSGGHWRPVRVLVMALLASGAIEATQSFIPGRWSSVSDIVTNGLGGWLGALGSRRLRHALGTEAGIAGRLLLDLPLVGFLWLMIPLLWLEALAAGGGKAAVIPAVAAAGIALAAAATSSSSGTGQPGRSLVPVMLGWQGVALAPLAVVTWQVAIAAAGAGVAGLLLAARHFAAVRRRERRIEARAVVIILAMLLPLLAGTTMPGLVPGLGSEAARSGILRWLAGGAAFTVLGYLLAEWHGRSSRRWPETAAVPMVLAALVTPLADPGAGIAGRLLPAVVAAGFGALLFDLQREHVVALRRRAARGVVGGDVTNLPRER